jgi:hypothetical protein
MRQAGGVRTQFRHCQRAIGCSLGRHHLPKMPALNSAATVTMVDRIPSRGQNRTLAPGDVALDAVLGKFLFHAFGKEGVQFNWT